MLRPVKGWKMTHSKMTTGFFMLCPTTDWKMTHSQMTTGFRLVSISRIVILILQLMPIDFKQLRTTIHFAHCVRSVAATRPNIEQGILIDEVRRAAGDSQMTMGVWGF